MDVAIWTASFVAHAGQGLFQLSSSGLVESLSEFEERTGPTETGEIFDYKPPVYNLTPASLHSVDFLR